MSKKTLFAAIKPFIRESILKMTESENDELPVFGHVNCFPYDAATLGEYRALCAEYKAERDNMERKKRKIKVKPLKAESLGGGIEKAKFLDCSGMVCSVYMPEPDAVIYVGEDVSGSSMILNQDQAAALIPLLKRFVRTGRIVKNEDCEA